MLAALQAATWLPLGRLFLLHLLGPSCPGQNREICGCVWCQSQMNQAPGINENERLIVLRILLYDRLGLLNGLVKLLLFDKLINGLELGLGARHAGDVLA